MSNPKSKIQNLKSKRFIVTIDGPAGVGKSTAAKLLAKRLGLRYLDTGATYRALAYAALRQQIDLNNHARLAHLGRALRIALEPLSSGGVRVLLNGEDVTRRIRTERVTEAAAILAQYPSVRRALVQLQRRLAAAGPSTVGTSSSRGRDSLRSPAGMVPAPSPEQSRRARSLAGVVAEGRDTGSVVFPHATHKFFLTANPSVRARRRQEELRGIQGHAPSATRIAHKLRERDRLDRTRRVGPLVKPSDAVVLDTSALGVDDVVERLLQHVAKNSDCAAGKNSVCYLFLSPQSHGVQHSSHGTRS